MGPRRRLPVTDPERLGRLLEALDEREHLVLRLRYGLAGQRQHSLEETGRLLGVSAQRARQIETRALANLRRLAESA